MIAKKRNGVSDVSLVARQQNELDNLISVLSKYDATRRYGEGDESAS